MTHPYDHVFFVSVCNLDLPAREASSNDTLDLILVYQKMNETDPQRSSGRRIASVGMAVCCIVMLAPIAAVLLAGGGIASITNNLGLLAPLALCLGMHVIMHRMMGRSCHEASEPEEDAQPIEIVETDGAAIVRPQRHTEAGKPLQS